MIHSIINAIYHPTCGTKRLLLSEIASIFDPMGWMQPLIIRAKLIMQETWKRKMEWDDPLPSELYENWITIRSNLRNISTLSIPRWISFSTSLHRFVYRHIRI